MKVDLRRLEEEQDARGILTADEPVTVIDAFDTERTVDCRIELSWERRGGATFFHGKLVGELPTQCHLCLEEVPAPVNGEFNVVLRKGGMRGSYDDEGEEAKDLVTLAPNQNEFSFDRYIIENLIVNIPMKIYCREDCKGLCPQCGINRNDSSCDCTEATDPRWEQLRKLKND